MLEFDELEKVKLLSCGTEVRHMFHYDCIYQWFNKKTDCPICRTDFTEKMNQMRKMNDVELKTIKDIEIKNFEEIKAKMENKRLS